MNGEYRVLAERLRPVARAAGEIILRLHREKVASRAKADGSPVTEADAAAEALILRALAEIAPDVPVVSEENPASHQTGAGARFWLVDPLDGTKEFLKADGKGAFTVNIALVEQAVPVLGVVFAPALGRMFHGWQGGGAFENWRNGDVAIHVRQPPKAGVVAVASASHRDARTDEWLAANRISQTVSIGSSLKFCLVAAGEADVYPRFGPTMEWDTAAGDAVLRAAGGMTTDAEGHPFQYGKPAYRNCEFIAYGGGRPRRSDVSG